MLVATILVAVASGCTTAAGGCAPLTLDDALSARLARWQDELDFTPVVPCGSGSLHVARITLDRPAGQPRLTFVVAADRSVFLMSQSRAVRAFTQVPDGARRLEWSVEGTLVRGFETVATAGPALLYLRWEVDRVTYEFQASLTRRYPSATLAAIARDNVARTLGAAAAP
ncbi:MAG: hypothetical protein KC472_00440 [Dehalococcoidia bacterium]|nr:hypothetical protein [Dehalococcoidia bacterium]